MMISPEMFVELHKDKKYKDLLSVFPSERLAAYRTLCGAIIHSGK